ncbi:MAG: threonylcarbamoyl-AMP synthase [Clostridiales bacterium]|nr:threonylcarbamoyl-AMP synthase [Clostridiales bacterium]
METKVYKIHDVQKNYKAIEEAAALIRQGQVVAFPTETVYGLGANALDGQAVNKIFEAKGRPNDNPLIVHVSKKEDIKPLVLGVPAEVYKLMETFWPGPLTIILKKSSIVTDETTAGLSTVALRMPNHPIALALIEKAGVPIAAPSANRSGRPSPTTAQHVFEDLSNIIPMILDGIEPCQVGIESTVLDMSGEVPIILRPGAITLEMLRPILGNVRVDETVLKPLTKGQSPKSPGMKYTHYSPKAQVIIFRGENLDAMAAEISKRAKEYVIEGKKVGILATDETIDKYGGGYLISLGSRRQPALIAARLFNSLREFDHIGVDIILAEWVDERDEGLAVMNRMIRAAGFHVINVSNESK